jgi:YesN/AraC family two-component response regulator
MSKFGGLPSSPRESNGRLRRECSSGSASSTLVGRAVDGEHALRLIENRGPDVALLDIRMPQLGGIDVCDGYKRPAIPCR